MPGWLDTRPTLTAEQTRLVDVHLVGNYAIAPTWGDGHHTGLLHRSAAARPVPVRRVHGAGAAGQPRWPTHRTRRATMIVATTPFIAGHRIVETKGQIFGLVVRSRGFSGNLIAGLRSLGGGEIQEYTSLLEDTRRQALDRLVKNATLMGANAVDLDALRQLRAGRDDVRDRRLRHGGRRRARRRRGPARRVAARAMLSATTRVAIAVVGVLAMRRRAGLDRLGGRRGRGRACGSSALGAASS